MKALLTGDATFEVDSGEITVVITRKENELLLAVKPNEPEPLPDEYWHSMNKD